MQIFRAKLTTKEWQFSLRWLLLSMTLFGIGLASARQFHLFKQTQFQVTRQIEALGGFVETTNFFGSPKWIRFDVLCNEPEIQPIRDEDGKFLATLGALKGIDLCYTSIGDGILASLAQLKNLDWLNLEQTQISESGIKFLETELPACKIYWDGRPAPRLNMRREN